MEPGTLGLEGRDLTTAPTPAPTPPLIEYRGSPGQFRCQMNVLKLQAASLLKNLLVQINSKLNSKPYDYLIDTI